MKPNVTKAKLRAGETVFGCFVRYPDPALAEFLGHTGWDFLMFDGEHGTMEPRDAENLVRAAELRNVTPIVRVPTNQPATILRLLDTGAQGLHIPWVNSGPEAEAAVRSVKYHPRGIRGLASVRAADYGQTVSLGQYVREANHESLVVIHIETAEAVDKIEEILAVEGIDVIFIGPTDLSHSLGHAGEPGHPSVMSAMGRVIQAVSRSRVALGTLVPSVSAAIDWRKRGARYIATGLEAIVAPAVKEFLRGAKG